MDRYSILILTVAAMCAAGGQLLFKLGAHGRMAVLEYLNAPIFIGLILYGIGTVLWIYALSFEKLVNVYAFTVLTFVLVYLGGIFLIKETITLGGFIGVLLVLSGLYVISTYGS